MNEKPVVHSYRKYLDALQRISELEEKNRKLLAENTDLKIRLNGLDKVPIEVLRVWIESKEGESK